MLWACELKPRSWWIDDMNVVSKCVELLHTLAVWLTDARCQHYFINNCNLFHHISNIESACIQLIAMKLSSVTETWLAEWFIHNYIQDCAQLCSDSVSRLFDNVRTNADLQQAVSEVVRERLIRLPFESHGFFFATQVMILHNMSDSSLNVRECLNRMTQIAACNQGLSTYFTAVTFLHVARKSTRKSLEDELLDVLATTCLKSNNLRRFRNARHSSSLSLSQAAMLMKVVANNSRSTVQLIEIELSKAYLYRALRCKDSDSDSIYYLANVYLAVLYYTTGQYQTAIDHCTLVTRSQDHSQCSSRVVQGQLLLKTENEIYNVLGLAVFYQYVRTDALSQQEVQHVTVFTTELFAHYLCIRCLSVTECLQPMSATLADEIQRYQKYFYESSEMFITDVLAFKLVYSTKYPGDFRKLICVKDQTKSVKSCQLDTSELVLLLQQSAVEHLTICRQLEARDFGSVDTVVTTDFEALYAYKRGDYQRCLQLSIENVCTLIRGDQSFSFVEALPEFIQLMDDNIASLIGLISIVNPLCMKKGCNFIIFQLPLSLYLMTQCQMKLRYPVTSLAQTLDCIEDALRTWELFTLDRLLLKLIERKILSYISVNNDPL